MKTSTATIIGIALCFVLMLGFFFFLNKNTITSEVMLVLNKSGNQQNVGPLQDLPFENAVALSKKLDPYRNRTAPTPLKETKFWQTTAAKISEAGNTTGLRLARVVQVINPLLEYEVELYTTGEKKNISILPTTKLHMPVYTYDDNKEISSVTFTSVNSRDILNTLELGSSVLLFSPTFMITDVESTESVPIELMVFAD